MRDDPGRHGRYVAVEVRAYTRPCKAKKEDVLFCIPYNSTFVPDTEKYPFLWLILLRVTHKNFLDFKGKTLDYIGREIFYY